MDSQNPLQRIDPKRVVAGLVADDPAIKGAASESPSTALAVIAQVHTQGGANLPVLARALDQALGLIPDPSEARRLLDQHVTHEVQAEMAAVHGDLPSVLVHVADPTVVVGALELDASKVETDPSGITSVALLIRAWAQNARARDDWSELLEQEIAGTSLYDLLIAAVYTDAGEDPEAVTPDMWVEAGLDPNDASERLEELLNQDELPRFSALDIAKARTRLRKLRQTFEQESAPAAVRKLVEDIDI